MSSSNDFATIREWYGVSDDNRDMLLTALSCSKTLGFQGVLSDLKSLGLPEQTSIDDLHKFAEDNEEVSEIMRIRRAFLKTQQTELVTKAASDTYTALREWYTNTKDSLKTITEFYKTYRGSHLNRALSKRLKEDGLPVLVSTQDLIRLFAEIPELRELRDRIKPERKKNMTEAENCQGEDRFLNAVRKHDPKQGGKFNCTQYSRDTGIPVKKVRKWFKAHNAQTQPHTQLSCDGSQPRNPNEEDWSCRQAQSYVDSTAIDPWQDIGEEDPYVDIDDNFEVHLRRSDGGWGQYLLE